MRGGRTPFRSMAFSAVKPLLDSAVTKDEDLHKAMNDTKRANPSMKDWTDLADRYSEGLAAAITTGVVKKFDIIEKYTQRYHEALLRSTSPKKKASSDDVKDDDMRVKNFMSRIVNQTTTRMSFDDIAGNQTAKDALRDAIELPSLYPDLFTGEREPPRYILMHGPPGTGKTLLAQVAANQVKADFLPVTPSSIKGGYVGDSERNVTAVFEAARRRARETARPVVIFIDEIDGVAPDRSGPAGKDVTTVGMVNQLLTEMEGFSTDKSLKIFVLAATNYITKIDSAVLSRFKQQILIDLPTKESIIIILKKLLNGLPNTLDEAAYEELAIMARQNKFAGRDVKSMASKIMLDNVKRVSDDEYGVAEAKIDIDQDSIDVKVNDDVIWTWAISEAAKVAENLGWPARQLEDALYMCEKREILTQRGVPADKIMTGAEVAKKADFAIIEPPISREMALKILKQIIDSKKRAAAGSMAAASRRGAASSRRVPGR